jgi:hypothetical protein
MRYRAVALLKRMREDVVAERSALLAALTAAGRDGPLGLSDRRAGTRGEWEERHWEETSK